MTCDASRGSSENESKRPRLLQIYQTDIQAQHKPKIVHYFFLRVGSIIYQCVFIIQLIQNMSKQSLHLPGEMGWVAGELG